jgi:hypothetical protein
MRDLKFLLLSLLLLGMISLFSTSSTSISAQTGRAFKARPLMGASTEEIQQAALDYTYAHFKVLGDTPTILLTRPVIKDELPLLGLSAIDFGGEEPPLMLVAIKGDVDVSDLRRSVRSPSPFIAKYIVYIFDLWVGAPTLIEYSLDSSHFRKLLIDPTLPEEPQAPDVSNELVPDIEPMTPAPKLPYRSVAPTVMPSSTVP